MDEVDEGNKLPTFFLIINQKQIIMIDLKECIKFCIENFTVEEATERLYKFVNESLELKEKEIELRNSIKVKNNLKVDKCKEDLLYLMQNVEEISKYEIDDTNILVFVDALPKLESQVMINDFKKKYPIVIFKND